jgi:aldehyde:ferredoxin oxidoreductase
MCDCPVACGKFLEAREGPWSGARCKVEYETLWSLGPHCGVFDYNAIIAAHQLIDEYGLDGMSAGYTVGFAMELYECGIIDKEFMGGINLRF